MNKDMRSFVTYNFSGSSAIAASAPINSKNAKVALVTIHFSANPGIADLTITLNSSLGANYDTILAKQAMSGVVDFVWPLSGNEYILNNGDSIDIAFSNPGAATYGIAVTIEAL